MVCSFIVFLDLIYYKPEDIAYQYLILRVFESFILSLSVLGQMDYVSLEK